MLADLGQRSGLCATCAWYKICISLRTGVSSVLSILNGLKDISRALHLSWYYAHTPSPSHPRQPRAKSQEPRCQDAKMPRGKGVKKIVYLDVDYDYDNDIVITLNNQHRFYMATLNEGDPVKVIGGKYNGLSAVFIKPTEKMYYIRLLDCNEVVRVLARNVVKVDARKDIIALIVDELQEIRHTVWRLN
jgi:hypothetical protein